MTSSLAGIKRLAARSALLSRLAGALRSRPTRNTVRVRGKGNVLRYKRARLSGVLIDIVGDDNVVQIGEGSEIAGVTIRMRGSGHRLEIGRAGRWLGGTFWFEDSGCRITIGEAAYAASAEIAITEPGSAIQIGSNCVFAYDIDIRNGDSHSIIDLVSGKRINYAQDITIEDHVWLAAHVTVLKGLVIGRDTVIGSGSVVTGSIPRNSVAAGVPAKVVRSGVTWLAERITDRNAST